MIRCHAYGIRIYDEDEVSNFLQIVDDVDIRRIKHGLAIAEDALSKAPPSERGIMLPDTAGLLAIFEALTCEAFLRSEELLTQYFDKPFALIQTNKKLKMNNFTPASTKFLFSANESRRSWAFFLWGKLRRDITRTEFENTIKEPLFDAMKRVQISALEPDFLPLFWKGANMIVSKLDQELITHSLRALDIDICKLALEHLQLNTTAFGDLISTIEQLLEKSPTQFWDAMGAISPVTVVEQIFQSPAFESVVLHAGQSTSSEAEVLDEAFAWIGPFLESIKLSNRSPACRALVNQLLTRFQSDKFSRFARSYCYSAGLSILALTLRSMNETRPGSEFVGAVSVSDVLDVVSNHIDGIIMQAAPNHDEDQSEARQRSLEVVHLALSVDCLSLTMERDNLMRNKPLDRETGTHSSKIWIAVIKNIRSGKLALASKSLLGSRVLIGIEKLVTKPGSVLHKDWKHFNDTFDQHSRYIVDILERLGDFDPEQLKGLFQDPESASSIIAPLLSSDSNTHQAAVDVLKVLSGETGRKEALGYVLKSYYSNTLAAFSSAIRRVAHRKTFTPTTKLLRLSTDIIDVLCNSQSGLLRSKTLNSEEAKATESFWVYLWQALSVVFDTTEAWSHIGHEKRDLMDFCRETMELADRVFDEYGIFASALKQATIAVDTGDDGDIGAQLLRHPKMTMNGMVKWLRLRDDYLASKSVALTSKLLVRLHDVSIEIAEETLRFIEDIVRGMVRVKLSQQQLAELERALETHLGRQLDSNKVPSKSSKGDKQGSLNAWVNKSDEVPLRKKPNQVIDLEKWRTKAAEGRVSSSASAAEDSNDSDGLQKLISESSKAADQYKARLQERQAKKLPASLGAKSKLQTPVNDASEFKRKREEEREAKRKRDALAIAVAKKNNPLRVGGSLTAEAGSGLAGLGVAGKDHAAKGTGMMVSSGEDTDRDDDEDDAWDRELFGISKSDKKHSARADDDARRARSLVAQPIKKKKFVRSSKEMRARLAPDLSDLHKTILSWDYFHDGDFPPNSRSDQYSSVPNTFRSPVDYQQVFRPLLTLEAWQGFVKAREESNFKPYEIKIVNRSSVDAFMEVSTTMAHTENKDIQIMEGDITLLSKARNPATAADEPHCLTRVYRVTRKKSALEITYRVMPGNPMVASLAPNATVYGIKIHSITPLEREYGALLGLQFYDLCDEIVRAKPSPLLTYTERQLQPIISIYNVNTAQAKAVKSAIDNDAFTLIQG